MSNSGKPEPPPTAPAGYYAGPQPSSGYPPTGSMALPGMVAPHGTGGGEANAGYVPVNNEKRPPMETVGAAATEVAAVAATTAAVVEHAASRIAPELVNPPTGTAAGSQHPYEAPPSYSQTVQPGGYPPPQPAYNTQAGYQQYPPQQGYPPQAAYPQAGAAATAAYSTTGPSQPTHTTSVVVVRPPMKQLPPKTNSWEKGLCSCFSNCGLCLLAWLCPCYVLGKNAEGLGHSCCLYGAGSIIPLIRCLAQIILRIEIRDRRGIKGSDFDDFLHVFCCTCCALTQEANEVRLMENQDIQRE